MKADDKEKLYAEAKEMIDKKPVAFFMVAVLEKIDNKAIGACFIGGNHNSVLFSLVNAMSVNPQIKELIIEAVFEYGIKNQTKNPVDFKTQGDA